MLGRAQLLKVTLNQAFNLGELVHVFGTDERNGHSLRFCTGGAANAVDVVLRVVGNIVVDDQVNAFDVNAAAHDIRSHHNSGTSRLEGT